MGLFCEDVRAEKASTESIIGVLPDNLSVGQTPGMLPKLAVYVRVQIDLDEVARPIAIMVKTPWNDILPLGEAEKSIVEQSLRDARNANLPFAGVILRGIMAPFVIRGPGLITAVAVVDGEEHVCAIMNVKVEVGEPARPA